VSVVGTSLLKKSSGKHFIFYSESCDWSWRIYICKMRKYSKTATRYAILGDKIVTLNLFALKFVLGSKWFGFCYFDNPSRIVKTFGQVQWATLVMTPASIRNTWKQGSWLLWPTVHHDKQPSNTRAKTISKLLCGPKLWLQHNAKFLRVTVSIYYECQNLQYGNITRVYLQLSRYYLRQILVCRGITRAKSWMQFFALPYLPISHFDPNFGYQGVLRLLAIRFGAWNWNWMVRSEILCWGLITPTITHFGEDVSLLRIL